MARSLFRVFAISDEQAMWRVQTQDDPHAFAELVARWEQPIQRLCTRMLGDEHRAEDMAQEAFARLFAKRKEYQANGRLSTFLWRIALNLCYDELRRLKRRQEAPLDAVDGEALAALETFVATEPSPDAALEKEERGRFVREALLQIAEPYRAVIVLRHYENLKFREIAAVLDIPEGTVKSRMAEALTQLQRLLRRVMDEPARKPKRESLMI
jgi:RNA polymerase sigma-70 factor (ECF subfamily)